MRRISNLLFALLLLTATVSCGHRNDYSPKPEAYLRLDMPPQSYHKVDTMALPFVFEASDEAEMHIKKDQNREKYIDLYYPRYQATVFLTYKALERGEWQAQVDTSYKFLSQHFDFSSGVDEKQYLDPSNHIVATTYQLKGSKVASTYQFWVSDTTSHFIRGALFLDRTPNNDSLAPVLDYLQHDLRHLVESIRWRE